MMGPDKDQHKTKGPKKIEVTIKNAQEEAKVPEEEASSLLEPPAEAQTVEGGNGDVVAMEPPPITPEQKIAELTNDLQRLAAEFENYRRRSEKEKRDARSLGMALVMEELLPTLDSFERSFSASAGMDNVQAWREGFEKVHRQLFSALSKMGLESVKPQKGDLLNPNVNEVMLMQPSSEVEPQSILDTFLVGYKMGDRLLRPAKVIVAMAIPAATDQEQGSES